MLRPIKVTNTDRRGLTIIEVLVTMGVIAILIALILPAILHSREAARKLQCGNNLRQLGQALTQFESVHGRFPYSWQDEHTYAVALLPYLDQQPLYEIAQQEQEQKIEHKDRTLYGMNLPVLVCPSDPGVDAKTEAGASSYRANWGNGVVWYGYNGLFVPPNGGAFGYRARESVPVADVRDGLSNTAAFAEGLTSDGSEDRLRVEWALPEEPSDEESIQKSCLAQPKEKGYLFIGKWELGRPWALDSPPKYYHALPPNSPSCSVGGWAWTGAISAGSTHVGGAHVMFADGHLQFVSETIDIEVWREFGSRSSDVYIERTDI